MRVVMTGGGTGGHIYPAIAIADKIKRKNPNAEILFIGAESGIERDVVPNEGYDIELISVRGFYRKYLWKNPGVIRDLLKSCGQARKILSEFNPDVVIGTGGYVCGPVVREAYKLGIRTYLHEQNAHPGFTNRMAERYADKVFIGFEEGRDHFKDRSKVVFTGNPVRKDFITSSIVNYREKFGIAANDLVVLSFGGSGGSRKINDTILGMVEKLTELDDIVVYFVTGKRDYSRVIEATKDIDLEETNIHIIEYTNAMHEYIAAADIVIGRGGAITLSEITVSGKPSILIPSPNVTNNHQYHNAKSVADQGGAILLEEERLTPDNLLSEILKLKNNKELLNRMAEASYKTGRSDAVDIIYDQLELGDAN